MAGGSHTCGTTLSLPLPTVRTNLRGCSRAHVGEQMTSATAVARMRVPPIMLTPHSVRCLRCALTETTFGGGEGGGRPQRCGEEAPRIIRGKSNRDSEAARGGNGGGRETALSRTKLPGNASIVFVHLPLTHIHFSFKQSIRLRKRASLSAILR